MRNFAHFILISFVLVSSLTMSKVFAETAEPAEHQPISKLAQLQGVAVVPAAPKMPFAAFTGKVTKNKVRMRHQPSLEGPILRELNEGTLLVVMDETEDFYAILPPNDIRGYVFRTYILDNVVEGNHVNIRLEPDLEAPVIGQLNSGDQVKGSISALNNKWLEIATPASCRFYVAKDYIEKVGGPHMIAAIEKRREEVNRLLNSTYLSNQTEMQKAFPDINPEPIIANYNKIIKNYSDFPDQVNRARELLNITQDTYLLKKVAYLEDKAQSAQQDLQAQFTHAEQVKIQEERLKELELKLEQESKTMAATASSYFDQETIKPHGPNVKMAVWMPVEEKLFASWQETNEGRNQQEFYEQEKLTAIALKGVLEPYNRSIKNKPGDFLLVNQANHQPIAYLYSTLVDLQDRVGQEITIQAIPRPNNHFAFPAYFVISME